jgi:hypothetical protein
MYSNTNLSSGNIVHRGTCHGDFEYKKKSKKEVLFLSSFGPDYLFNDNQWYIDFHT